MPTSVRDPEFYLSHSGYVHALARHVVFDEHAAEDLSQETWLAALARPPRDASSPRRWLKALVRNIALTAWLRNERRDDREAALVDREPVSTPDEVVEHELARRRVVEALLALDEPYRSTLIQRFFDDLEPREIAAKLQVPVETVRTRIKRGLERLRTRMQAEQAWSLLLVRGLKLQPPSATVVMSSTLRGILIMSAVKKSVLVGAAIVLVLASVWWSTRGAATRGESASVVPPKEELAALPPTDEVPPANTLPREVVDTPRANAAPAETATKASDVGSLALHVVWGDDKSPAADVALNVYSFSFQNFDQQAIEARTNSNGDVRLDALALGQTLIDFDRGAQALVVIEPGTVAQKTVEVPAGVDVDGIVRDIDGRAFSGAEISLACMDGAKHVVARSGADGKFVIRAVGAELLASVSAQARGRAPTRPHLIQGSVGTKVSVELAFTTDGGALEGRVADEHGEPVPHAIVLVGNEGFDLELQRDPSSLVPAARRVVADEQGAFACDGLAEGTQPIQVGALGFAPWRSDIEIVRGRTVTRAIAIEHGARLAGIARDEHGVALKDVSIQVGKWDFATLRKTTRDDGSYELESLPNAEFEVVASSDGVGRASTKLVGSSGATLRWDPVLTKDRTLKGRIEAPGRELNGWSVTARAMDWNAARFSQDTLTDSNGRFELTNCPDAPLHLEVRSPTSGYFKLATLEHVEVTERELVIVPDLALEPSATLSGRVVDDRGQPIAGAHVGAYPQSEGGGVSMLTASGTGRFESERVPSGEWRLHVYTDGFASRWVAPRHVDSGAIDVGDIALERGGSLTLRLRTDQTLDPKLTGVSLVNDFGFIAFERPLDGVVRFTSIGSGRVCAFAYVDGIAMRAQYFDVRDGAETRGDLELIAGVAVRIDVVDATGRAIGERVECEMLDATGRTIDSTPLVADHGTARWSRRLVPGRHTMRIHDARGRTGALEFDVAETADGAPQQLSIALR